MLRLLFLLALSVSCAWAQEAAKFEEVVKAFSRDDQFMGSVLVAKDGATVFAQSVGWAQAEWKIPNAAGTKFRLGSVTKQFTAAAILLLKEQGKLDLEDPLSKLLPDVPKAWGAVTLRQVLSHTGGVPSFTEQKEYLTWKLSPEGPATIVAHIADKPLDFTPGEKFHYSNTGYVLLGWIVERVSGQSYEAFLQQHIFQPLGMKDSGYDSNSTILPNRAAGYQSGAHGLVNAPYIDMHVPGGAGALYSTTGDLVRWTQGLFGGKVLQPESLEQMTTPVKSDYGFGVFSATKNGRQEFSHSGGIEGFSTFLAYYPESKVTIVVLSNSSSTATGPLAQNLAAVEFGQPVKLPVERKVVSVPRAVLEKYLGRYVLRPDFAITVALDGDALTAQATNQPALPIFPESETKFFLKAVNAQIEFFVDASGAVTHLNLHQGGRDQKGVRQ